MERIEREHVMREVARFPTWATETGFGVANWRTMVVRVRGGRCYEPLTPKALERIAWRTGLGVEECRRRLFEGRWVHTEHAQYKLKR